MSGTGGQRRVGAAFLENFMIGLPSISEQETFETIYRQADKFRICWLQIAIYRDVWKSEY